MAYGHKLTDEEKEKGMIYEYDINNLNDEQIKDVDKLLEKLEEDDDVQNVYHTMQ